MQQKKIKRVFPNYIMNFIQWKKENKEAIKLYKNVGFELGKRSLWFYWNPKKKIK